MQCPNCGRPVPAHARTCSYCGSSLLADYFAKPQEETAPVPAGPAGIAGTILGVCGGVALLVALVFHLLALFGFCEPTLAPRIGLFWAVRTLFMTIAPVVLLVQQLVLRGRRTGLLLDCSWIFLSAAGLMLVIQSYLDRQADAFYGVSMIPYLLVVGAVLILIGGIAGAIGCRTTD